MTLYEFTIEVQDGENEYILPRFVAAQTPQTAARFARQAAETHLPFAQYDARSNCYQARGSHISWRIGSIRSVSEIHAPSAEGKATVAFTVQCATPGNPTGAKLRICYGGPRSAT